MGWSPDGHLRGGLQGTHADRERLSGCRAPHRVYVRETSKQQRRLRGVVRGAEKGLHAHGGGGCPADWNRVGSPVPA